MTSTHLSSPADGGTSEPPRARPRGTVRTHVLVALAGVALVVGLTALLTLSRGPGVFAWGRSLAGGPNDCRLSGQVTWQGRPILRGQMEFLCQMAPVEYVDQMAAAERVAVPIRDGKYTATQSDGLIPGWYLVRIVAEEGPGGTPILAPAPPDPERRPVRYQQVRQRLLEVTEGSTRVLDFELD